MYYTYMLRCADDSIYTGITTDLDRRMMEHFEKQKVGAKYTKSRAAKKLERVWTSDDRAIASKLEYHIKKLTKVQKEEMIKSGELHMRLQDKIDVEDYCLYI